MQCGLAAALLEFLARSAWTRFVAPNLRRSATKRSHVAKWFRSKQSLRLEVVVNPIHPCSSAHYQCLAQFCADWLLVGTHCRIGVVFMSQRKYRYKRPAILIVIY